MDKQQIKQRAFAAYMGCQLIYVEDNKYTYTNYGVVGEDVCIELSETINFTYIDKLQLSLTPLSDITDQDAIEVARIINSHEPHSPCLQLDVSMVKAGYLIDDIKNSSLWNYDAIDYLRSRNYNIPFMGLDLIQEGWAVLKNKDNE